MSYRPTVSILIPCYSRQVHLNKSLPAWLAQMGVSFEILVGCGPGVSVPDLPNIRGIDLSHIGNYKLNSWNNELLNCARGRFVYITMCDIVPLSVTQIKRQMDLWEPGAIVTDRYFRDNERDPGIWLQCALMERDMLHAAGGWCEDYDAGVGWEDTDVMARLFDNGAKLKIMSSPKETGVYHINHVYEYRIDPKYGEKYVRNKSLFHSRHKRSVMEMLEKKDPRITLHD